MAVFMVQGASAGIIGALLGAVLGRCSPASSTISCRLSALLDGAALPVAIEPLQVVGIAGRDGHCAAFYALSFLAGCRHSTR